MKRTAGLLACMLTLLPLLPSATLSQVAADRDFHTGLKLGGALVYNRSDVAIRRGDLEGSKVGWGAGIEWVTGTLGIGLSGYTGLPDADVDATRMRFVVLAEANMYAPIPSVRIAPYVGVHTGLGAYTRTYFDDPTLPSIGDRTPGSLGIQIGARWKPLPLLGLDFRWRQLSESASELQDSPFQVSQILLGATLF
jgi:hypothetical protein